MSPLRFRLERLAQRLVDLWFMVLPRHRPTRQAMRACRIVSHRGEHDNLRVRENTLAAFAAVHDAGGWGIEFDVRWTRDLHPVVIHDANTRRVFDIDLEVAEVSFDELRQRVAEVPSLEEVVQRFGTRLHLMMELKRDQIGAEAEKSERLKDLLATLTPVVDYHILALDFDLFELVQFADDKACLPVAELNTRHLSTESLARGLGGVCGHYLLLNQSMIEQHHYGGKKLGTGFVSSKFCLYRELNRGVDWIFTDHALKLVQLRQQQLRE